MKSRVFVSCGQHTPAEREVATKLQALLRARGFDVYVAINAQTILEINAGIINELKNSDCYLLINLRREPIGEECRGSLFSNQELAIAYALGFERILVVNQRGVRREGMLAYIGINTETFDGFEDCCPAVERALDRAGWTASYSRRVHADNLRFSEEVITFGPLAGRFLYVDVFNGRPDIAALEATARLCEFQCSGTGPRPSPIRSPLKATGRPGFHHTIFPRSHEAFDLLCVGGFWTRSDGVIVIGNPGVYLNSALDVVGAGCLGTEAGIWRLRYEVYAIGFPLLSISIAIDISNWERPVADLLEAEVR